METTPERGDELSGSQAQRSKRKVKPARFEKDIFGDEFLGSRRVMHITLDLDELPEGARIFLKTLVAIPLEFSAFEKLIQEAMTQVSPQFWEDELERYSPDEWKLLRALNDEPFRQKVEALLRSHSTLAQ